MSRLVLVADDSPTHQRRAQGILTGEGLEVITVSNGVAAIKKLPSMKPSLVLADVSMPGRDGYEVCEFVKNSPELARVPVLLAFSELEPYDEARAQRVRADGRIRKPFGQDELLAVVQRFLPETEEAAPPPPPPPPAEEESAPVTEPVDLPPEESARIEAPDLGALSDGAAFADQFLQEPTPPAPEAPTPSLTEEPLTFPIPAMESPAEEHAVGEEPGTSEPVLEEETEAPELEEPSSGERTMMFRAPVQIAEPMLAEEEAPAAPVTEAPTAEEAEVPAAVPESLAPSEASAGEVSVAPPAPEEPPTEEPAVAAAEEAEAPPPPPPPEEAAAAAAAEPAASTAAVLDTDLVHWIVHNVVVRMAPPALATSAVEELIHQITDEMINELTQPPPEPQS